MAYRMCVVLAVLGFIACGDDGGGGGTQNDANNNSDGNNGTIDAAMTDSPPMTGDGGVGAACGTTTCSSTEECCVEGGGATCVAATTCGGVAFVCDGPEDCGANEVCCYGNEGNGSAGTGGSECRQTNQCQINACHVDTDCSGQTAKCCPVTNTPYSVCLAQCPMM